MCLGCWGLLWLCVCLSLHRDTGNCATLIPAIGTVCLAPLYNADKLSSGGLSTEPALTHTYTHALFIVWRCCKKRESVEVVVGKKHEIREKMVSSKNWQTLESFFFYLPWCTHILTQRFVQEEGSVHAVCLRLAGFLFHWTDGWWCVLNTAVEVIMIIIYYVIDKI